MLSYLRGTIKNSVDQRIVIDIGSLAFTLQVPDETQFKVDEQALVFTHMHWNQENGPTFFGFSSEADRTVFLLITSCSGLGPKIALSILASLGTRAFFDAVLRGDEQALSNVNGIGPKKAEQMIVQLKHKVEKVIKSGVELGQGSQTLEHWSNVSDVLGSLNYTKVEITRAMKHLSEQFSDKPTVPFDLLMRQALAFLSKKV